MNLSELCWVNNAKGTVFFPASFRDHIGSFRLLGRRYHYGMGFYDPRLLPRDLFQGVTQAVHVVHADGSNDLDNRGPDHIGGV